MPGDALCGSQNSLRREQTKAPGIIAWNPRAPKSPTLGSCWLSLRRRPRGGKKRGRRKELGREAGGRGGAADQVIRRIINLDGSLEQGRKLRRLPDA